MPTVGDYEIPEIRLIQNTGGSYYKQQLKAKPGNFVSTIDATVYDKGFDMIVVRVDKLRTYWGRADISNDPPECSSDNAASYRSRDGKDCHKCPHFTDSPGAIKTAERRNYCTTSYNVIAIDPSTEMPFLLRVTGISVGEVQKMNSYLHFNRKIRGNEHRVIFHVGSISTKTAAGEAYALSIIPHKELLEEGELATSVKITAAELRGVPMLEEGNKEDADGTYPPDMLESPPEDQQMPEKPATDGSIAVDTSAGEKKVDLNF